MAETIEQYQDGLQIRIKDYGKSLRRLFVAAVIIGAAIWYSDHAEVVNVANVPSELDVTPGGPTATKNATGSNMQPTPTSLESS